MKPEDKIIELVKTLSIGKSEAERELTKIKDLIMVNFSTGRSGNPITIDEAETNIYKMIVDTLTYYQSQLQQERELLKRCRKTILAYGPGLLADELIRHLDNGN